MKHNIKILNTLTGKKDTLKPIRGKRINIFVCGPTVYDYPHLGHAKLALTFDFFVKYLRRIGFDVFYLQNITDLDDKIIARAREKGVLPKDLATAFEKEYIGNMKMLGANSVSKYARATSHIKEIIGQVKRLQAKKFAYTIEGDGIYYDISKFKKYGKLSGRTVLQGEDAVTRIDYSKHKKNRGDFCLWKFSSENEPSWPSPFGAGRPGWHIEDTAITEKFFGPQYDIHGGARELIFPHHEAEIAQMEAISGKSPLVKYWMHVGVLNIGGQKMSKSLGNFITIGDFLKRCSPNYLRFFIAKNLWRSPVDYSESVMIEVKSAVEKIEEFLRKLKTVNSKFGTRNSKFIKTFEKSFYAELDDDFNTPKAFAVMFEFIKKANELLENNSVSKEDAKNIHSFFEEINKIFGIINFKKVTASIPSQIKKLASEREKFRKQQNWQKSDQLRAEIERHGFTVQDSDSGPVVRQM
ncbi:MAG: cysteine--tRNA ligase [Candidatus Staskawiczbacteria bacterium RIFOXYD2_FULL_37_9]|uniref:Cysteine--tRNA ligase n=1 Tax=Candidatus Staskawiczbacteria bacterium RIFOXYB1_FULL_37_44 TaxID=1802223 RepID=A0A1G2IWY3_9BACT|nr:MAG: cysteine--tRNA ligase [Candidatus Staskawiczbacteria bacterium RIFOXYB1_FULL_37_44]OGZ83733.1 MAG: cysteine--tRNA ligase [Candidatus Staskawiczbacteria bacterium RIFOXYC1_FULL_37_52]OGZ90259.1 MAG: cysteine--tRNA ligase [Candidatus Staskawiczbacteria bacterium RIFOXYD1_FULL_37_110]OGZ93034.1 MAG: cysteine--tRNA ligase [Candidatus Staskawiczbacteria bacterium RIFOXYD2_FULL_37_9]